mgnify:CR=1 FL=1
MRAPVIVGIDLVAILIFAVIGRASHAHELTLDGIVQTGWPFVVAGLIGSVLSIVLGGPWWRQGVIVWLVTVVGGMTLRVLGGEPLLEGLVEAFDLALGLGVVGGAVLLRDAALVQFDLEAVGSAAVAGG